jgi:hypothetical protein
VCVRKVGGLLFVARKAAAIGPAVCPGPPNRRLEQSGARNKDEDGNDGLGHAASTGSGGVAMLVGETDALQHYLRALDRCATPRGEADKRLVVDETAHSRLKRP